MAPNPTPAATELKRQKTRRNSIISTIEWMSGQGGKVRHTTTEIRDKDTKEKNLVVS
jgi:hypothetical protein